MTHSFNLTPSTLFTASASSSLLKLWWWLSIFDKNDEDWNMISSWDIKVFERPFLSWGGIKICWWIRCILIQSRGLETDKVRLLFQLESGFCPKKLWENGSVRRQRGFPGRKYKSCLYGLQHLITKPRARLERASDKAFLLEENQQEGENYRKRSGEPGLTGFKPP